MRRRSILAVAALVAILIALGAISARAFFNQIKTTPQPISIAEIAPPPVTIDYESASSNDADHSTRISVDRPRHVEPGWLLIAVVGTEGTPSVSPPHGWTPFGGTVASSPQVEQVSQRCFYRFAGPGEPTSYTFRLSRSKDVTAGVIAYSGVRASNPIDDVADADGHSETANAPRAEAQYDTRRLVAATFAERTILHFRGVRKIWSRKASAIGGGAGDGAQPAGPTGNASVRGHPGESDWVIQTVVLNASP